MVFTIYGNKFHRLTQYLQRIIQLDTFTDRHVCIYRAMQQQQRGINLVRIEQCSMLRKQIGIIPRIAIGCLPQQSYRNIPNNPRPNSSLHC